MSGILHFPPLIQVIFILGLLQYCVLGIIFPIILGIHTFLLCGVPYLLRPLNSFFDSLPYFNGVHSPELSEEEHIGIRILKSFLSSTLTFDWQYGSYRILDWISVFLGILKALLSKFPAFLSFECDLFPLPNPRVLESSLQRRLLLNY